MAYLACSLALLVLLRRGRVASRRAGWLAAAGAVGASYSLWAIAGAGRDAVLWGAALILAALPVYWLMRRIASPGVAPPQGPEPPPRAPGRQPVTSDSLRALRSLC